MADKDKPTPANLTFSTLDAEAAPEPFVYATRASRRVVFPDLYGMEADKGEKYLQDARRMTDGEFLKKWLSADDLAALQEDRLTLRQRTQLVQAALAHYEQTMGSPGEDNASDS